MLLIHSYSTVDTATFLDFYKALKIKLPHHVLRKIEAYKHPLDQQRSLIGLLMVRLYYAEILHKKWTEISFEENEHEKPLLAGIAHHYFNISHSGNQVIAAFSCKEIGVDIEKAKGDRRKIAERFFTPDEIAEIRMAVSAEEQIAGFYRFWTLKESYMKAIGGGMSMSLSSFAFTKGIHGFQLAYSAYDSHWNFLCPEWDDGYFLSICTKSSDTLQHQKISLAEIVKRVNTE